MKRQKLGFILVLVICSLLIAGGCGNNKETAKETPAPASESQVAKNTPSQGSESQPSETLSLTRDGVYD